MNPGWDVRELAWPRDVEAAVRAFAGESELAWLDSSDAGGCYSLIVREPIAHVEQPCHGDAEFRIDGQRVAQDAGGWRMLRDAMSRIARLPEAPFEIVPGWVGYLGFELARQLERLPATKPGGLGLPLLRMALFDQGLVFDHGEHKVFAISATGIRSSLQLAEQSLDDLANDWTNAISAEPEIKDGAVLRVRHEQSQAEHERRIRLALDYISAGDIYQVNLAHRIRIEGLRDALQTYGCLRKANPAPYGALLRWAGGALASVSPELFLRLRGRDVLTRPIKGTRPRGADPVLDASYREQLLSSEKEAAELAMIVDLHRNDLGRVCEIGSVRVEHARLVEAHPTVFHTCADVRGRLRVDRDALDLIEACFPAGSVSGVPKIRALEIIDELEPIERGAYTGAIGVLGLDGGMTLSVAIRTLQMCGSQAALYVGGGIVADSAPAEEYAETLAKARGILEGLGISKLPERAPAEPDRR